MDRLQKKAASTSCAGRCASPACGTHHPPDCAQDRRWDTDTLTVQLKNYVLLSPEAINLDDANRIKLQQIANAEPLA